MSTLTRWLRKTVALILCFQLAGLGWLHADNPDERYLEIPGSSHNTGLGGESPDTRYVESVEAEILHFVQAPSETAPSHIHEYVEFSEQELWLRPKVGWWAHLGSSFLQNARVNESEFLRYDLYAATPSRGNAFIDFERDVDVQILPSGKLALVYKRAHAGQQGGEQSVMARHVLARYQVVAYTYDRDILVFADAQGRILGVDMALARTTAFDVPIPIFRLAQLAPQIVEGMQGGGAEGVTADFIQRKMAPITQLHFHRQAIYPVELKTDPAGPIYAGDLVLRNGEGLILGWYDRQQLVMRMGLAEILLGVQAYWASPGLQSLKIGEILEALANNPQVAKSLQGSPDLADPLLTRFLALLPTGMVKDLLKLGDYRNQLAKARKRDITDRMTLHEWAQSYQAAQLNPAQELSAPGHWRSLAQRWLGVRQYLTGENIKRVAYMTLFGATGAGVYWAGNNIDPLTAQYGLQALPWLVHITNQAADLLIPDILANLGYQLKGTPYWLPLTIHLVTFLAFPTALRWVAQYFAQRRGWHFTKALTTAGMRIDAFFNYPVLNGIARLMLQQRMLEAMRSGVAPWTRIEPQSAVGKALGLSETLWPTWTSWSEVSALTEEAKKSQERKLKAVELLRQQSSRKDLMAWLLANAVVSESMDVDLATLKVLFDRGQIVLSPGEMRSAKFLKKWEETASHLRLVLAEVEELGLVPLEQISEADLARYFRMAKSLAQQLRSDPRYKVERELLKQRWKQSAKRTIQAIADFGYDENRFLRSAEANDFIAREHWQQLKTDTRFSTMFMSLWGGRADFSRPERLAADPHGPMMTNPSHFADLVESGLIYAVSAAASMALVYQHGEGTALGRITQIDRRYSPIEDFQAEEFVERADSFFPALKRWLSNGLNLPKAAYGEYFLRGILKQLRTAQGYYIRGALVRLAFAGQSLELASVAIAYTWLAGKLTFGWPWLLVNRTDHLYTAELTANRERLVEARRAMLLALRDQDALALHSSLGQMRGLYKASTQSGLVQLLEQVRQRIGIAEPEVSVAAERLAEYVDHLSLMYEVLESGDANRLRSLYNDFVQRYSADGEAEASYNLEMRDIESRVRRLLLLSDQYAPLPTQFNRTLHRGVLLSAASLCAYWASFMFADSYHLDLATLTQRLGEALVFVPSTFFVIIAGDRTLRRIWHQREGLIFASYLRIQSLGQRVLARKELEEGLESGWANSPRGGQWQIPTPRFPVAGDQPALKESGKSSGRPSCRRVF